MANQNRATILRPICIGSLETEKRVHRIHDTLETGLQMIFRSLVASHKKGLAGFATNGFPRLWITSLQDILIICHSLEGEPRFIWLFQNYGALGSC